MSATMMHGYPGISRGKSEYDSGIGDQFFRGGVEPPRTGGGNGKFFHYIKKYEWIKFETYNYLIAMIDIHILSLIF